MSLFDVTARFNPEQEKGIADKLIDNASNLLGQATTALATIPKSLAAAFTGQQVRETLATQGLENEALAQQAAAEAERVIAEEEANVAYWLRYPYAQFIARPLSSVLLVMNENYRTNAPAVTAADNFESKVQTNVNPLNAVSIMSNVDGWKRAWEDARNVSPMQALVGYIGSNIDGSQGVDYVDFSDAEQVRSYFDHGIQRIITGAGDGVLGWYADPVALGASGIGIAGRKLITVPLTAKNQMQIYKAIDDAAAKTAQNGWSIQIDGMKQNSDDLGYFLSLSLVNNDLKFAQKLQTATQYALKTGDDTYIADALKVGYGDTKTIDKVIYDATYEAQELGILSKETQAVRTKLKNMDKEPLSSTPMGSKLLQFRKARIAGLEKEAAIIRERRNVLDEIAEPGELKQRQTVSQFEFIERKRVENAQKFASSYYEDTVLPSGARILHYLRPGSMLREQPSNYAVVGGITGDYSYYEFSARARQVQKLTGKTPQWTKRVDNMYFGLREKGQRLKMMDQLETKGMTDILVKELGGLTDSQRKVAVELGRMLANNSRMHRRAYLEQVIRSDFTINDGTGSPMLLEFLKDHIDDAAKQIAASRTKQPDAVVTPEDIALAKETVIASLKQQAVATVQIPNIHFSIDLNQFAQVIKENRDVLTKMVQALDDDPRYAGGQIEKVFEDFVKNKSESMLLGESIESAARQTGDVLTDYAINSLDTLYNVIWKPQILASLHYTSRNVSEGWGRTVGMAWEFSADTGIPFSQVISGAFEKQTLARLFNNANVITKDKVARYELNKFKQEIAKEEGLYSEQLFNAVKAGSDSIFTSNLQALVYADNIVKNYGELRRLPGTRLRDEVTDSMSSFLYRLSDTSTLPKGVNEELFSLVFKNDALNFFKVVASVDERYVSVTLGELQKRFRTEREKLIALKDDPEYVNLPENMKRSLTELELMLQYSENGVASAMTSAMAKAKVRGRLNELIGDTDVLNNLQRYGEGEFQLVDGIQAPDIYRGVVGEILRGEVSMINSTTATIFNVNRNTTGRILNGVLDERRIEPYTFDATTGVTVSNPYWASYAADRANREFRDVLTRKIAQVNPLDEKALRWVYKWARYSQDPEAIRWRREMKEEIQDLRDGGFPNPVMEIVKRRATTVAGLVPTIGIDGQVIRPLVDDAGNYVLTEKGKKIPGTSIIATESGQLVPSLPVKALAGELTVEDMLAIPEMQRRSVVGSVLEPSILSGSGLWRRIVNVIFKWIGSLPEDAFVRHPTARMLYQAEMKRIGQLWLKQGRSVDYIENNLARLQESGYKFAYESVMNRLYSVQRYTDPAYTLRFISPFYMAKQNSNRFWFGYAMRNPKAAVRYFTLWSMPGRIFDVENEDGVDVGENINPFLNQNVAAMISIPDSVARALGIPEDTRFSSPLATWDLINNGYAPFFPEPGGPIVTTGIGALLPAISGKNYDPELFLAKMGYDPEVIRKTILPYYQSNYGMSPSETLMAMFINPASWLRSAATITAAPGGVVPEGLGELIDPKATERFNSLMVKNFRQEYENWADNQDPNDILTPKEQTELILEMMGKATATAINELSFEATWAFGPTVGSVKIESYVDRKAKELRILQQKYGYEEGRIRFINQETTVGGEGQVDKDGYNVYTTATFTPRETNVFGLTATPQTLNNIQRNKELFKILGTMQKGSDSAPDSKVLGALFNGGDRVKDFSTVANEKLYRMEFKKPAVNDETTAIAVAVDSGWDEYFALTDYYNSLAKSQGIEPGSTDFKNTYKAQLDADIDALSKRNPLWAKESGEINRYKADTNTQVILGVLGDEKFMNTVGKDSKLIDAVQSYFIYRKDLVRRRLEISKDLDVDIYQSSKYDSIIADKEYYINAISQQIPEFREFATYYLRKDPLFSDGKIVGE